jgi:LysR family transcriptional regulator, glycine cleavage system transcriptional activator
MTSSTTAGAWRFPIRATWCREGGAVGLADLDMIEADLKQGRLVRLFDVGVSMVPTYAYHLVYPQGNGEDARVVAFREWMLGEMKACGAGQPDRSAA